LQLRGAAYESRLTKYATRGFAVGVPGLDLSLVDHAYFKVKMEKNDYGSTDYIGPGWSWGKWQNSAGTLERLLLNEAAAEAVGFLNPFQGRFRKEVKQVDRIKHFLLTPTGHDIGIRQHT